MQLPQTLTVGQYSCNIARHNMQLPQTLTVGQYSCNIARHNMQLPQTLTVGQYSCNNGALSAADCFRSLCTSTAHPSGCDQTQETENTGTAS